MKSKRPVFLAIRATETDWRNVERIKELLKFAQPSVRVNQTIVVSEALRLTVQRLEREIASSITPAPAQPEPQNGTQAAK